MRNVARCMPQKAHRLRPDWRKRDADVLSWRESGFGFKEIAEELGITNSAAQQAVKRAELRRRQWLEERDKLVEAWRSFGDSFGFDPYPPA